MSEVWLHGNRRLFIVPIAASMLLSVICLALGAPESASDRGTAWLLGCLAFSSAALGLWFISRLPRIAFDGRSLLLRIRNGSPIAVPIELVEAFLMGKGPTYLNGKDDRKTEATTLILRVSERAPEFEKLETNLRLAAWCGHYVTFRGTWTEPLNVDLVNKLNQRLYDAQQALKRPAAATTGSTR